MASRAPGSPGSVLKADYFRRLQALGTRCHFKFDGLALVQRFGALGFNGGIVDENVLARLPLDKAEPVYGELIF